MAKFFRSCEIKKFPTKPWSFPLLCLKLFDTRILSKHRNVLLRILSALWNKNFSKEFSDIPFLCIKFFDRRNFLKHRSVFPTKFFGTVWQKVFDGETWYPLPFSLMHKIFRYPKFSDTPKCSPTKFFGTVTQKISNEMSWYPSFA